MLFRWLTIKKNTVICGSFLGVLCLLFFTLSAQATFYEISGAISWGNKVFKNVEAYLLDDRLPVENNIHKEALSRDASHNGFTEEFALLEKEKMSFGTGPETKKAKVVKEKLGKDLRSIVNKYKKRKIDINREGEFFLNVGPESFYYVVVFKKKKLFEKGKHLQFWIEKLYFTGGEVTNPRKLVFDESNVITW